MKILPILEENLDFIRFDLTRHYIQVDCDFTCYIVLNPSGIIPLGGTDVCLLHVGSWQIDAWSFLTDKFTKGTPGFSACLCWDKTLVTEQYKAPQVAESDIDTANSISSLKGQPVNITGFSLPEGDGLPVKTYEEQYVNTRSFDFLSGKYVPYFTRRKYLVIGVGSILSAADMEFLESYKISDNNFLFPKFSFALKNFPSTGFIGLKYDRGCVETLWHNDSLNPDGSYNKEISYEANINIGFSERRVTSIQVDMTCNWYSVPVGTSSHHSISHNFVSGEILHISD